MWPLLKKLHGHRLFRYVMAGGISYCVEVGSFLAFYYLLHINSGIANVLSMLTSLSVNYLLSHFFVFKDQQVHLGQSLPRYLALVVFNITVSSLIVEVLVTHLHAPGFIVKPFVSAGIAGWTYFAYRVFVFKNATALADPAASAPGSNR
jgi:putative flippase GtrA